MPDSLFKFSSYYSEQKKSLNILHGFTNQVLNFDELPLLTSNDVTYFATF